MAGDTFMMAIRTREDFEKLSLEELVLEQQKIMKHIMKFENKYILHNEKNESNKEPEIMMIESPSPTVKWRVISEELITITKLIDDKTRDEYGIGIELY